MISRLARQTWRWLVLVLSAPFLMFPMVVPTATVAVIALVVTMAAVESLKEGRGPLPSSPLTWPLTLLMITVVVGLIVSSVPDVSIPKFTGVILGVLLLRTLLIEGTTPERVGGAVSLYAVAGIAIVALGLLSTEWSRKLVDPATIAVWVPRTFGGLPGAEHGANANALGGTTLFFIPLLTTMCASNWLKRPSSKIATAASDSMCHRPSRLTPWSTVSHMVVVAALLGFLAVLAVAQSRTAWMSACVTVVLLFAFLYPAVRWVCAAAAIGGLMTWVFRGSAFVAAALVPSSAHMGRSIEEAGISLASRLELWSRAVDGIRDFAFTGMGLSAFRRVVHIMYPLQSVTPETDVAHAHNIFLQTALDVGLPGLVAYVAILLLCLLMCIRVYRRGGLAEGWLALGLSGNLIAVHLFGLSDAIALGAKVGLFFWWNVGMIAALHQCVSARSLANLNVARPSPAEMV